MGLPKRRVVFISMLLLGIFMGCQDNDVNENPNPKLVEVESKYDHITNEVIEQQTNVSIHIEEENYSLPITELKVILDNKGDVSVGYDNPVYLDKLQDGIWVQIPYNDDLGFSMEASELRPGESTEQEIDPENLNYELTNGDYRIRKSIRVGTENIVIADKFEIKD